MPRLTAVKPMALKPRRPDPAVVGEKVLANLARARAARRKHGDFFRRVISHYVLLDLQDGGTRWGQGRRIHARLRGKLSLRMVNKYLAQLASGSQSPR